jgi:hypothetical protein
VWTTLLLLAVVVVVFLVVAEAALAVLELARLSRLLVDSLTLLLLELVGLELLALDLPQTEQALTVGTPFFLPSLQMVVEAVVLTYLLLEHQLQMEKLEVLVGVVGYKETPVLEERAVLEIRL